MFPKPSEVQLLKEQYPRGTKVILEYMDDPHAPPPRTKGEVIHVDDIGQIHVRWENGSGLALNVDVDDFHIINE